ncbi:hypothetical protein B0H16DRAFT_1550179 [Mycena metata]|uniref:Uncharacterized protein n=1 Tax=Mycena metata TaxID=1033252 RepID=A0AAD7N8X0_9AGAR|nr:hypothetical protein B0H16DRAFT_1550179 [Mycena metata]
MDLVLMTALPIAQSFIYQNTVLDNELATNHQEPGEVWQPAKFDKNDDDEKTSRSWLLIRPEVEIKDQVLSSTPYIAYHGSVDYMTVVVSTMEASRRHHTTLGNTPIVWDDRQRPFAMASLPYSLSSVKEAQSPSTFSDEESEAQVLIQGASACILTQPPKIVNVLSDGPRWKFYIISKQTETSSHPRPKDLEY